MRSAAREIHFLVLTGFAALPLYLTQAIAPVVVAAFHAALLVIGLALAHGGSLRFLSRVSRIAAMAYFPFFFFDAAALSNSLIRASVHLLFFIALYQALDPESRKSRPQRMLVIFLLFITSLATATHQAIVIFVLGFAVLAFAQLMRLSSETSAADLDREPVSRPVVRAALVFVLPTALIAIALFPVLPRRGTPIFRGITRGLDSAATGISETIDFRENRRISSDPTAIARVWMPQDAIPFFIPLRLRATVYDGWEEGEWIRLHRRAGERIVDPEGGTITIARPAGYSRAARIEQHTPGKWRLLLPVGTWAVSGLREINLVGAYGTAYFTTASADSVDELTYEVSMSREIDPLVARPAGVVDYPIDPEVGAMAQRLASGARGPREAASIIERTLSSEFEYLPDPSDLGRAVSVDEFLLETRRGHCEYFAAGMVVLLAALDIPARIVGGYYGGELNPLIGSFVIRERDAHAWVEVFDGRRWVVFDPTPADLRPGSSSRNLFRAYLDAVRDSASYFWDRYILTFGSDDQVDLAMRAILAVRNAQRALGERLRSLGASAAGSLVVWWVALALPVALALTLLVRSRRRSRFERLARILAELGITSTRATAPGELLARVRRERPDLVPLVEPIVEAYLRERFAPVPAPSELRHAADSALRRLAAH
ncbi:MAG TPA: transglutaminaseTgpA domain-containing protein [Thermoanaerobaculia bacterium]|nr:transglutaminaseTgpA domain-containing protein [Thermoanaerobaculia bacterium]